MTKIDQFESIFRAAAKEKFEPEEIQVDKVLVITDKGPTDSEPFLQEAQSFLRAFSERYHPQWEHLLGGDYTSVNGLLESVDQSKPDLICTYRNLHTPAPEHPYSLGVYVDVLTQATNVPILLMPRMELQSESEKRKLVETGTAKVMAITDHLAGSHHLVNVAANLVKSGGKLILTHVEDQRTFDRFLSVIDKIAEIDSDVARTSIMEKLLAEPNDYVASCKEIIGQKENLEIEAIVTVGHRMNDYRRIIDEQNIDLLIMHTKDEDQLAMHGLAYPLAVELRAIPMLLL